MVKRTKKLTTEEIENTVKEAIAKNTVSKRDVEDTVRKVVRDTSLKEELWRDAVKEGVVAAMWDISGYGLIAVFTLMVTGIVISAFLFSVLAYFVFRTVFMV